MGVPSPTSRPDLDMFQYGLWEQPSGRRSGSNRSSHWWTRHRQGRTGCTRSNTTGLYRRRAVRSPSVGILRRFDLVARRRDVPNEVAAQLMTLGFDQAAARSRMVDCASTNAGSALTPPAPSTRPAAAAPPINDRRCMTCLLLRLRCLQSPTGRKRKRLWSLAMSSTSSVNEFRNSSGDS
jgi:hypothetical protein